jgi:hypothetical protein
MATNNIFDRRSYDRRLFLWAAIGFAVVAFAGFAQTYYLKPVLASLPLRTITHIHGMVMTAWVLFFIAQVYLIRSKNVAFHMRMGWAGVALAAVVFVVGIITSIQAAKYGSVASPPDIPPLQFLIVPIGDMIVFAIIFAAAIYYRKDAASHKRLLLVTAFNFIPAAVARLPYAPMAELGPLWFYGFPDLIMLIVLGIDTWKNGKVNKAFAFGAVFLIVSHIFRLMFMSSAAWMSFATWVTS